MKKVSVVVPVYNTSLYLKECIDSLVNQTLDDIEIILINDGSTDNSLSIINEYKKKYPQKIIIISQENLGISVARNAGIKVSKGKYIGFVDSDDFVKLDMFEKLYEKIENANCDIVVCDYQKYTMIDNNYEYIDVTKNIKKDNIYEDPSLIFNIDFGPCNKLYKKELFNDIKFPINKKYEDLNAILKVFLEAQKISVIKSPLYIYRQNFRRFVSLCKIK